MRMLYPKIPLNFYQNYPQIHDLVRAKISIPNDAYNDSNKLWSTNNLETNCCEREGIKKHMETQNEDAGLKTDRWVVSNRQAWNLPISCFRISN